jgi:hypothetical protein
MKNKWAGQGRVSMEECKRRAIVYGSTLREIEPPSCFARAIWPDHSMTSQGAGFAAVAVLKALERDGRAGWRPRDRYSREGWWVR